jgi:hypothetical protein
VGLRGILDHLDPVWGRHLDELTHFSRLSGEVDRQ